MLSRKDRQEVRKAVRSRIRKKIAGTAERPRVSVFRSLKHISVQAIDDATGRTIVSASTLDPEVKGQAARGGNVAAARVVGAVLAARLLAAGRDSVVFDRSGYIYHGRVKALAEAARAKGLKF
jgi:large subunit ribosomal protein L18